MAALLALMMVSIAASALTARRAGPHVQHKPAGARPRPTIARPGAAVPVSGAELRRARAAAAGFLAGYLPFTYGRARWRSVDAVTPALRRQLMLERAQVTPVERRRQARVVSINLAGQASGVVLATALVEDGGITAYALRITLRRGPDAWLVSAVDGG